jgi:hypothetical protein
MMNVERLLIFSRCILVTFIFIPSFNLLGPELPPVLKEVTYPYTPANAFPFYTEVYIMGNQITNVAPRSLEGSMLGGLDLSLNNLQSGVHRNSFTGARGPLKIGLSNCHLRSSSLVAGMFDANMSVQ